MISLLVEFFSLIPSLLLVEFFRRIRTRSSRSQRPSPLYRALKTMKAHGLISSVVQCSSKSLSLASMMFRKKKLIVNGRRDKQRCTFPWWCLFLAYGLSLLIIATSIFFILIRGIEFGDLKSQQWLTSLILGFFSSTLVLQPIKVTDPHWTPRLRRSLLIRLFSSPSSSPVYSITPPMKRMTRSRRTSMITCS